MLAHEIQIRPSTGRFYSLFFRLSSVVAIEVKRFWSKVIFLNTKNLPKMWQKWIKFNEIDDRPIDWNKLKSIERNKPNWNIFQIKCGIDTELCTTEITQRRLSTIWYACELRDDYTMIVLAVIRTGSYAVLCMESTPNIRVSFASPLPSTLCASVLRLPMLVCVCACAFMCLHVYSCKQRATISFNLVGRSYTFGVGDDNGDKTARARELAHAEQDTQASQKTHIQREFVFRAKQQRKRKKTQK